MSLGQILFARHDGLLTLKLVGDIRYTLGSLHLLSRSLDTLLDRIFIGQPEEEIVVDMRETVGIDSTNLGILVRIALRSEAQFQRRPTIIGPPPGVRRVLESMGVDRVFTIVAGSPTDTPDLAPLPPSSATEQERLRMVLDAHQRLMNLSEQNRAMFEEVVTLLQEDLEAMRRRGEE